MNLLWNLKIFTKLLSKCIDLRIFSPFPLVSNELSSISVDLILIGFRRNSTGNASSGAWAIVEAL